MIFKKNLLPLWSLFVLVNTINLGYVTSIQAVAKTILESKIARKFSASNIETRQNLFPNVTSNVMVVHVAAVAYGASDITLSGLQTIDGVELIVGDRVLLNGQTDPIQNGLWVVQADSWTRPTDFLAGSIAGTAYVLITGGDNYNGTSWVCVTSSATIETDDLLFAQYGF